MIDKNTWSTIIIIATIVGGYILITDRIGTMIDDAVKPLNIRVTGLETEVKKLSESNILFKYKCEAFERYFVKPNDIKLENE